MRPPACTTSAKVVSENDTVEAAVSSVEVTGE